tara:strand:- start:8510 stop:8680 length:171 start_codon:yes stop_codon:yes gene_type:complete
MNDYLDYLKTFGVNGATLAAVNLDAVETVLSIILLGLTICWTAWKIIRLAKDKKDD